MRISYNRDRDIMLLEISPETVDIAEEMGPVIVHFSKEGKPVLLEILDASDFLATAAKATMTARTTDPIDVSL
jgi:uncharacterized protein YuzE